MTSKFLKLAGLAVAGIVVGMLLSASGTVSFGGIYNQTTKYFNRGLTAGPSDQFQVSSDGVITIGTNGTGIGGVKFGSCTIWAGSNTIAATTTQQVECQSATDGTLASGLTGVTTDSVCTLNNASSTNTSSGSILVAGVSASSTAGSIVARIVNLTGTTFTWSAAASSSAKWSYACNDPA